MDARRPPRRGARSSVGGARVPRRRPRRLPPQRRRARRQERHPRHGREVDLERRTLTVATDRGPTVELDPPLRGRARRPRLRPHRPRRPGRHRRARLRPRSARGRAAGVGLRRLSRARAQTRLYAPVRPRSASSTGTSSPRAIGQRHGWHARSSDKTPSNSPPYRRSQTRAKSPDAPKNAADASASKHSRPPSGASPPPKRNSTTSAGSAAVVNAPGYKQRSPRQRT